MLSHDIIVVGGGAAGCMAAIAAAEAGASVLLLEKNAKIGRKLYITGKGRCNVTNACSREETLRSIPGNGRFLYGALSRFDADDTMAFFEELGVPLKIERGNRVFPVSDHSTDIIDALLRCLRRKRVQLAQETVTGLIVEEKTVKGVSTDEGSYQCKAVILATGGVSYPLTGSTGDGYRFAQQVGHTVIPPQPSLVPLEVPGEICRRMQGLSLRNVVLTVKQQKGKQIFSQQGEMLFTHFGVSGPLVLSASAHMRDYTRNCYTLHIDLKPALEEKKLDERLLRELANASNRDFSNVLSTLVPHTMLPVLLERTGIAGTTKANAITRQQRRLLLETLKDFSLPVSGPRPVEEAIITAGGVKTGEIDPKTMGSKRAAGLFFAGELIDVDAYTGGFNLQIAWATGREAGLSAARYCQENIGEDGK